MTAAAAAEAVNGLDRKWPPAAFTLISTQAQAQAQTSGSNNIGLQSSELHSSLLSSPRVLCCGPWHAPAAVLLLCITIVADGEASSSNVASESDDITCRSRIVEGRRPVAVM